MERAKNPDPNGHFGEVNHCRMKIQRGIVESVLKLDQRGLGARVLFSHQASWMAFGQSPPLNRTFLPSGCEDKVGLTSRQAALTSSEDGWDLLPV